MSAPEIFLLHAYSPRNSGDGVLVKLSVNMIRDASISGRIAVVCLDKPAFEGYLDDPNIELMSLSEFLFRAVSQVFSRKVGLFVGVGGGYLRAGTAREGWKTLVAHGLQILGAGLGWRARKIYLPQSVGPFRGVSGTLLRDLIARNVNTLFVRDNKSKEEFDYSNVVRMPDLVALEIGKEVSNIQQRKMVHAKELEVYFVFRDLSGKNYSASYVEKITELAKMFPDAKFALQSEGRGNSDDMFYRRVFGIERAIPLRNLIARRNGVVVSVRLHGSLESVLGGLPSVHIAYERKGYAAYQDLGLDDYVFHASSFDVVRIAEIVTRLRGDPELFWSSLKTESVQRHSEIVELIKNEVEAINNVVNGR
jgi:polysaccharide pyruvyl transferase WcaK-like protein